MKHIIHLENKNAQVWIDGKISKNKSTRLPNIVKSRRGQVWVETMIYTLIGFALIAAVLAFAKPKIEQMQDKAVIDQSMAILESMNAEILSVIQGGAGNKRVVTVGIKEGEIIINPLENSINFQMDTKLKYSELDKEISVGSVYVKTTKIGSENRVILKSNYTSDFSGYNLRYANSTEIKTLSKSSTPYKLAISNDGNLIINLEVIG
jgi:hypothetical protein